MRRTALAVVLALITGPLLAAGSGHNRYKWTDASGNLHYGDALPPEAVNFGYEVVNSQGVVVKHVDRPKTAEERAAAKVEIAKAQAAKEAADARVRNDEQLVAAYPTEDDLKRAQHQQADMLDQNIASAQLGLESQQKSLAELLGHAADLDSSGKPVPKGERPLFRKGTWLTASVYERSRLGAGDTIKGPAIIEQDDTTTIVLPGWSARTDAANNLHLERHQS